MFYNYLVKIQAFFLYLIKNKFKLQLNRNFIIIEKKNPLDNIKFVLFYIILKEIESYLIQYYE